jgi:signal transduction histidine kinase/ActR/RegA family two-component response regulator
LTRKLKAAVISGKKLLKELVTIFDDARENLELVSFGSAADYLESETGSFDFVVVPIDSVNRARLSLSKLKTDSIPLMFIYPDNVLSLHDYRDLIVNGAFGLVPESNLKSILQHAHRLRERQVLMEESGKSLAENLIRLNSVDDSSLFSIIDSDFRYISVSDSFSKYHRLKKDEIEGNTPSGIWGEKIFRENIRENLEKSLGGELIRYKAYFNNSESAGRYYEVIYKPFKHPFDGGKLAMVETRDITDKEEELRKNREILARSYYYEKFLPMGIFECDTSGKVLSANDTFYNILSIPEEKKEAVLLSDFFENDKRFLNYINSVHEGEATTFGHLHANTWKENDIYVRMSTYCRRVSSGELKIHATLEDQTREVILERKLNQAQRIETLGSLAGGIAHDFNTILTTIAGYSELAMDEVSPESGVYDYMERQLNSVNRAESIVTQMLTFSRQIEIEKVPVRVEKVVREAVSFMEAALPHNIGLKLEIKKSHGYVNADPTQLFRVFLNIMTNSMQAMESGGGKIRVRVDSLKTDSGSMAVIRISDTGSGIDKSVIERIYEPFFTTKEQGKGTGMGLSVAHGIITGLGGEIAVDSSPGEGTLFTISIPIMESLSEEQSLAIQDTDRDKILYLDNNIHFSRTVSLALERMNYDVRLVHDQEQLQRYLLNEKHIKYIFMRCNFEEESKEELLRSLLETFRGAGIVLITRPGIATYRKVLNIDRKRFTILTEPVSLREIVNTLQSKY